MLHTFPGFLGYASDWSFLEEGITHDFKGTIAPFWKWATDFNQRTMTGTSAVLAGYSLGGRLALHALLQNPKQWAGGVIVSAHPGLATEEERKRRAESDAVWSERFQHMPWNEVIDLWNAQEVFHGVQGPVRKEQDCVRQDLADMLAVWSLAKQENLTAQIEKLNLPLLWIVGEKDVTFRNNIPSLIHSKSQVYIVPNVGHRVPWEAPLIIAQVISDFVLDIGQNFRRY